MCRLKRAIDLHCCINRAEWAAQSNYLDVLDERGLFLWTFFSDLSLRERCLEAALEAMRRRLSALPRAEDDDDDDDDDAGAGVTSGDSSFSSSSPESDSVIISGEAGRTTCTTATSSSSDGVPEGVTDVVPELLACSRTL